MRTRAMLLTTWMVGLALPVEAHAGKAWMGIGAGVVADMGDRASGESVDFGVGPQLVVPIRIDTTDWLRVRIDLGLEGGWGLDQLTWSRDIMGEATRFTDDGQHLAIIGVLALDAGIEADIPLRGIARPYLGATLGVGGVGAYHAMRGETAILLDPEQNDIGNPRNIDPHTVQAVLRTGVSLGLRIRASDKVAVYAETGYSAALVGQKALKKARPELDAQREAFAWNPLRGSLGVVFRL